jgi:hypothetical protein
MAVTVAELGDRVLRRLGVVAVAAGDRPTSTTTTSAADIASRALQGLGIIVPASDRPSVGTATPTAIAARAMQNLGVVVPEGDRPVVTATTVTVTELAARALQAMDIPVPASAWPTAGGTVSYTAVAAGGADPAGRDRVGRDAADLSIRRWPRPWRRPCTRPWRGAGW